MHASVPPDERPLADPRPFLVLAGIAATAIAVLVVLLLRSPGVPALVAEDYMRVAGGLIVPPPTSPSGLSAAVSPPGALLPVPELDAEGYALAGGQSHQLDGSSGLLAVYYNRRRDLLVYQVWPGSTESLPQTRDVRELDDRRFFVHQKATTTLVFWQQDGLVRVVASSLPTEQVVKIAVAAATA
jgi:hypothetical protein